ncbi:MULTISPECIES: MarR family winged helix-turn-helix transcriptional regulator [unclassified Brevundimonas]|uniref:MarR family winged helix-turn-helix transcriptional regulator n=1 Tax=unclassified Brevundimonas TaxID=2622653 RepID=UPI0025C1BD5E|nr:MULTISPECIES: MarR family transcriptional regulator [unclassified Brevundimonas]
MSKSLNSRTPALEDFLCFSLYGAGLAMTRLYKPLLEPFNLTYPQYLVLTALKEKGGVKVGELGERLQLETNTLTPLVKRLEAAGLVSRQRDKADERVVRVALTAQGQDVVIAAHACIPQQVLEATGLSAEELQDLNRKLKTLQAELVEG